MTPSTAIFTIALGFDQCYVLRGTGVVAIDAGQPGKGRTFVEGLTRAGVRPEEVDLILLTHGHWDHMGSAAEIKKLTGARLAIHRLEADWIEHADPPLPPGVTTWGKVFMAVHETIMPLIELTPARVDLRLGDDGLSLHDYGIRGRVVHTPGHSPGSMSVLLESGEAFVGDLAFNRFPLTLSPGLPIFADDLEAVKRSWKRLLAEGIRTVYPAHGRPFSARVMQRKLR